MESKRVLDKAFEYMDAHFGGATYYPGSMEWDRCVVQARYYFDVRRREYLGWLTGRMAALFRYPATGSLVELKSEAMLRNRTDLRQALLCRVCGWGASETEALIVRHGGGKEFETCAASEAYPFRIGIKGDDGYYEYIPAVLFRGYFNDLVVDSELLEELLYAGIE